MIGIIFIKEEDEKAMNIFPKIEMITDSQESFGDIVSIQVNDVYVLCIVVRNVSTFSSYKEYIPLVTASGLKEFVAVSEGSFSSNKRIRWIGASVDFEPKVLSHKTKDFSVGSLIIQSGRIYFVFSGESHPRFYDIDNFESTNFNYLEHYIISERWSIVVKNSDGSSKIVYSFAAESTPDVDAMIP
ncbi:hypothetical protein [Methylobrevis albus]|uniref:Uncharacterized protein n=1 Tax=Methylobrevis albus TaxID=2793297 RepID=A0A931I4L9_9HYPH|nr:hypothetical protein [Methylobrevis albus]MBH0239120.1 hypothetical protein [Methylobrevis albus]